MASPPLSKNRHTFVFPPSLFKTAGKVAGDGSTPAVKKVACFGKKIIDNALPASMPLSLAICTNLQSCCAFKIDHTYKSTCPLSPTCVTLFQRTQARWPVQTLSKKQYDTPLFSHLHCSRQQERWRVMGARRLSKSCVLRQKNTRQRAAQPPEIKKVERGLCVQTPKPNAKPIHVSLSFFAYSKGGGG